MIIVKENDIKKSKDEIVAQAYSVCKNANFPVEKDDVYDHLYGSEELIQRFLINEKKEIVGFGVAQEYNIRNEEDLLTLAYLQGIVIDKRYQGKGYSVDLLKNLYDCFNSDFYGLRTQNPKMAKAMLHLFKETVLKIPTTLDEKISSDVYRRLLELLKTIPPYENINEKGIVKECYPIQLCKDSNGLQLINPDIVIGEKDALVVVVQPKINNYKLLIKK